MGWIFGGSSFVFRHWPIWAGIFTLSFLALMWVTGPVAPDPETGEVPEDPPSQRIVAWVSGAFAVVSGLLLAGVGFVYLEKVQLHTYGVLLSVGFLVAILFSLREARRVGEDPERILDIAFWILVSAIIGSRVLFIVTTWGDYWADLQKVPHWYQWKLFRVWEGGLVFYGGFLAALAVSLWYMHRNRMGLLKSSDILVPSVAIGQFFGRIGCFAAGCCHGKPSTLPWSVTFQEGLATPHIPLHPTQLYEASINLFIFIALLWIRSSKRYHGQVLAWYLLLYGVGRFTVEIFRGDAERGFLFAYDITPISQGYDILSTSQFISILFFITGLVIIFWRSKRPSFA